MLGLRCDAAAAAGRLLRVLLVRLGAVSARSSGTRRRNRSNALLHEVIIVASDTGRRSLDWLQRPGASLSAWWIPKIVIFAALLVPVLCRAAIWIAALAWMGAACILNARRCGRTHCRYTGPYYLVMIVPVLVLASGGMSVGTYGWLVLAVLIVAGSGIIWWATERAWGNYS